MKKTYRVMTMYLMIAALVVMPLLALPKDAQANQPKDQRVLLASAARTATVNSAQVSVGANATIVVGCYSVTAASGTSPTLNITIQFSPDGGTTWFDIAGTASTSNIATTIAEAKTSTGGFSRLVRARAVIGGTTPSFTFSVHIVYY